MMKAKKNVLPAFLFMSSQKPLVIHRAPCVTCFSTYHVNDEELAKQPKTRVRQHVNPLSATFQKPVQLIDNWVDKLYADKALPFHIDIGCGKGNFCMELASKNVKVNVLGLEIRKSVAAFCVKTAEKSQLRNVGFICCNANIDLAGIMFEISKHSRVANVSIQFPDPYFKAKQHKRRVVQPQLVDIIAAGTDEETGVFLQSDVFEVAKEMRERFRNHKNFVDTKIDVSEWLDKNPFEILTERESSAARDGLSVYRSLFKRQ